MSFFTDLETAIEVEAKVIEADIAKVIKFFKPLVIASAEDLAKVALQAVLSSAVLTISGQEKLSVAVTNVQNTLTSQGKTIGLNLINAAVQAAHDKIATLGQ